MPNVLHRPKQARSSLLQTLQLIRDPLGCSLRDLQAYGDPMTVKILGAAPIFVTADPESIRSIFSAPTEMFGSTMPASFEPVLGKGSLLALSGDRHRRMRKLLTPAFHGQRMRLYGQQIRDITCRQTAHLQANDVFVAQTLLRSISLQLIMQIVFGVTAEDRLSQLEAQIHAFMNAAGIGLFLLPRWELLGLSPWARFMKTRRRLQALVDEELAQRRQQPGSRTDILSMLLESRYDDGSAMTDEEIFDQLLTLLAAGHLTTAAAVSWTLHFLLHAPAALARLQSELAAQGPTPEPDATAQLPFLEAVCNESLRLRPGVALVSRKLQAPMLIKGAEVPAGATVGAQVLWAHFNPVIFPDPQQFRPERFLERSYTPVEFMPFGGGIRRCIGAALAMYQMKLMLSTLLTTFDLAPANQQPIRYAQGAGSLEPMTPIKLLVRSRRAS